MKDDAPAEIKDLARARSVARADRDWPEADRLREEIEAAGWKVVDQGTRYRLERAGPADVVEGEQVRYGRSASVPSRLAEPASAFATVVVRAASDGAAVVRALDGLRRHAPVGTQVVIVADAPDQATIAALDASAGPGSRPIAGEPAEVVWTVERLGPAASANVGVRRAVGDVAILLGSDVELTGDSVTPLVRALDDPSVAASGAWGSVSADLRRWEEAPPGDADVIDLALVAFRRADFASRGPLDERLRTGRHLATWWSLVLRDAGEGEESRRAVRLDGLPVVRHRGQDGSAEGSDEQARLEKRDFYRVLDRFGRRRDLLTAGRTARRLAKA